MNRLAGTLLAAVRIEKRVQRIDRVALHRQSRMLLALPAGTALFGLDARRDDPEIALDLGVVERDGPITIIVRVTDTSTGQTVERDIGFALKKARPD